MGDRDYGRVTGTDDRAEAAPRVYRRDVEQAVDAYRAAHDAHYRARHMNLPPTIATLVDAGWQSAKDNLVAVLTDRQTQPYLRENIVLLLDTLSAPYEKE